MDKRFDDWNEYKKYLDISEKESVQFHEPEIWWCSIGINIGSEQNSGTDNFSRPVLIVRKWSPRKGL
jgi:hypothetical protein